MDQLGFSSQMVDAISTRDDKAINNVRSKWKKSLTTAQRTRFEELSRQSVPDLRKLAGFLTKKAPEGLRGKVSAAIKTINDTDSMRFLMIDLEYGVVGSMPPVPFKVGGTNKLYGRSIKFGSINGPSQEGIVIDTVSVARRGQKPVTKLRVFVQGAKAPIEVALDQVIGIGTVKVESTMVKQVPEHAFSSRAGNEGEKTVPDVTD